MKQRFTVRVWQEGDWFVAQCIDVDVASQGRTESEAIVNLREALELYYESPMATTPPPLTPIEVEIAAA